MGTVYRYIEKHKIGENKYEKVYKSVDPYSAMQALIAEAGKMTVKIVPNNYRS